MTISAATESFVYEAQTDWPRLPEGMSLIEVPDVSVAADGTVYLFLRNFANPIVVLSPDGEFIRTWGADRLTGRAHAVLAAHDGFIYCVEDTANRVTKWTPTGDLVMTITTEAPRYSGRPFNRPTDVVVSADGRIFISDGYGNARIHRYSADGVFEMSWGGPGIEPGQFLVPHNIALDGERIYVADREAHRVQVFDLDGGLIDIWNNKAHRPCGITVGPDHNIYIGENRAMHLLEGSEGVGHCVSVWDPRGNLLTRFGDPREGEAPGQFIAPHGMAVNAQGDVFVGEVSYTSRGRAMDPPKELKSFTRLRRMA